MTASPRSIRVLPQSMINKIAAGEVIERPASVVKELVENAVDAGATRIDVLIEQGGADLIRIVDNGCGIRPDQLELALSPHATSKIVEADDLFKILTFGFRGEALASIAEISQMTVKSRVENSNEGSEIQSNGGQRTVPIPCGMPVGTQIEVRNLFFNTPVRRKYMKSATTEFGHVAETFVRLALPQPGIHFTLRHAGRVVHDLPPERQRQPFMLSRVRQLFGEEVAKEMIAIESRPSSIVKVHGLVSHPNHSRANNRMQYFFLNGRFIRDKALQHALMEAYRGILTVGRFPLAFLHVELPPDHFDVNVHPTKMEVRFLDSNKVYSGFLGAIRDKFLSTDLHGRFSASASKSVPSSSHADATDPRSAMEGASTAEVAESKIKGTVQDWINRENDTDRVKHAPSGLPKSGHSATAPSYRSTAGLSLHALPSYGLPPHDFGQPKTAPISSDRMAYSPQGKIVVQMHDRYLVMETADGIALIDQHALHERLLYEQLKERVKLGKLESQRLLVPVPVDLSPNERACVEENLDFFKTLGLTVEPFGGDTMLISTVPALLQKTPPAEILISLVEPVLLLEPKLLSELKSKSGKKSDLTAETGQLPESQQLDNILHSMACKAAIKAGNKMSSESIAKLVELAENEINAHHCPHGRPSMLLFSKEEIDKMFRRT